MIYKIILFSLIIFIASCSEKSKKIEYMQKYNNYSNKGFALIYDEKLFKNKIVNKKLNDRSLLIYNKNLEEETLVRITNLINGKYLIAKVGKNASYPFFYNSVVSKRIAADLQINIIEPYIEIKTLNQNNSFIINKAKTFDEEKLVANKAPVDGIKIQNISKNKTDVKKVKSNLKIKKKFNYIIKIAELYFKDSAEMLKDRLINDYNINNVKIKKITSNKYLVYKGPFKSLESIKIEYNDIIKLKFEKIEIIKL